MEYILWTIYIIGALVATVVAAIYFIFKSRAKTIAGLAIRSIAVGVFWLPIVLLGIGQSIYKRAQRKRKNEIYNRVGY